MDYFDQTGRMHKLSQVFSICARHIVDFYMRWFLSFFSHVDMPNSSISCTFHSSIFGSDPPILARLQSAVSYLWWRIGVRCHTCSILNSTLWLKECMNYSNTGKWFLEIVHQIMKVVKTKVFDISSRRLQKHKCRMQNIFDQVHKMRHSGLSLVWSPDYALVRAIKLMLLLL